MPIKIGKPKSTVQPTMEVHEAHTKDKGKTVISESIKQVAVGPEVEGGKEIPVVGVGFHRVWSDGNFGSYRVAVSLNLPVGVPVDMELVDKTFLQAHSWAEEKMQAMLKGIPGAQ